MISPYKYYFDPQGNSTAARVTRMVGANKRVLELGCAYGVMSQVLAEVNGCRILGVEIDADAAEHAKPFCERILIANLDTTDWDSLFGDELFDVIIAADVLEHLREPGKQLLEMARYLVPGGYMVLSVPNIAQLPTRFL